MAENYHNALPGLIDLTSDPSYVPPAQYGTQALDNVQGYRTRRSHEGDTDILPQIIETDSSEVDGKGRFEGRLSPHNLAAAGIAQALPVQRSGGKHRRPEAAPADPSTDQPTVRLKIGKMSIGLPSGRTAADTLPLPKLAPAKPRDLAQRVRIADYFSGRQRALQSMQEERLTEADVIRNRRARGH